MKHTRSVLVCLALFGAAGPTFAQAPAVAEPAKPARVLTDLVDSTEKQITGIAEEMPETAYGFAPTNGAFRGVRNFAEQVKHAGAVHYLVGASLLGEAAPADTADERGPESAKSKAQVLKYLKDSFAYLRKAVATIDEKNAFMPIKGPFGPRPDTRVGLAVLAISHTSNHYGQIVEYLRMNNLVPPQ